MLLELTLPGLNTIIAIVMQLPVVSLLHVIIVWYIFFSFVALSLVVLCSVLPLFLNVIMFFL